MITKTTANELIVQNQLLKTYFKNLFYKTKLILNLIYR